MSSTIHFLLLFLACFGVANAHFKLNTPPTRGFDEDKQPTAPCGGFDTLQNPRNNLPLTGGKIALAAFHPNALVVSNIIFSVNPTPADFANGSSSRKQLTPDVRLGAVGPAESVPIDLTKYPEAKDGAPATIQVVFDGGDGLLYQCSDVLLGNAGANGNGNGTAAGTQAQNSGAKSLNGGAVFGWMGVVAVLGMLVL